MSTQNKGLAARFGVPPLTEVRRTTAAVLVDTVGVGLMIPISLLYFTLTTDIAVAELGVALTAATLLSLPAGLAGGAMTDRFGPKLAMVTNNLVSAAGYVLYLLADGLATAFLAMLLVAIADRMYWACWSSYVHTLSGGRPFERWFAFLESIKAGAMGIGALLATVILAAGTDAGARWLVVLNIATCVAAALLFVLQPMSPPAADAAAAGGQDDEDPELLQAVRGWRTAFAGRANRLFVIGQVLLSPVMLLPSVALPLLFVERWDMPVYVSTLLFALNTGIAALIQTPLSHAVRFRSRAGVICFSAGLLSASLLLMAAMPERQSALAWCVVVVVGVVLAVVDALYMPASNALMTESVPDAVRGRTVAVFQTAAAVGMAVFPACFGFVFEFSSALTWVLLAVVIAAGGLCFAAAAARLPHAVRFPEFRKPDEATAGAPGSLAGSQ
ncbi:MFS transporter [Streptomyces abyssomicinicus]|uniref:MFS transporter n=1 Tax=Streptomyces abyssomicinicus TaxID=574929 RepID=UPI0012505C5F|nr:MFS transporter [Streptomyces abyssomicinicus]